MWSIRTVNADNRHVLSLPTLGRKLTLPVTFLFELHNFFARPPRNDRSGNCQKSADSSHPVRNRPPVHLLSSLIPVPNLTRSPSIPLDSTRRRLQKPEHSVRRFMNGLQGCHHCCQTSKSKGNDWTTQHQRHPTAKPSHTPGRPDHGLVVKRILVTSHHYLPPASDTSHLTRSRHIFNQQDPTNRGRMVAGSDTRATGEVHRPVAVSTTTRR